LDHEGVVGHGDTLKGRGTRGVWGGGGNGEGKEREREALNTLLLVWSTHAVFTLSAL
jgi:hypothetical protein